MAYSGDLLAYLLKPLLGPFYVLVGGRLLAGTNTAAAAKVVVEYPFEFMVLQPVAQLVVNGSTAGQAFTMRMTTIMRNE